MGNNLTTVNLGTDKTAKQLAAGYSYMIFGTTIASNVGVGQKMDSVMEIQNIVTHQVKWEIIYSRSYSIKQQNKLLLVHWCVF